MSTNPIEENSTPKTTGNLEELFRHHLGEEAAVPPRPMLWDQVDNSLLTRQNEVYRQRLTATRWVAAASLLLATLAGTGWWSMHDARLGGTDVAKVSPRTSTKAKAAVGTNAVTGNAGRLATGASRTFTAPAAAIASGNTPTQPAATNSALAHFGAASNNNYSANHSVANKHVASRHITNQHPIFPYAATRPTSFGSVSARNGLESNPANTLKNGLKNGLAASREPNTGVASANASGFASTAADHVANQARMAQAATAGIAETTSTAAGQGFATVATESAVAGGTAAPASATIGADMGGNTVSSAAAMAQTGASAKQLNLLATRLAALQLADPAALPNGLAKVPVPIEHTVPVDAHRWHYGASYTAGMFNPNVNFSRAGIAAEYNYNLALGAGSPALTEAAAAQYRQNLRPGLSQRIALLAMRHLTGHWSLSTGAEFSQATAQSATSLSFVGEQILDLSQDSTGPLHTTNFRYRMASIPIEIRYANPVKRGWSLYGRFGGVMSALLGVRSEVEGNPEATRTYSLFSAGTPYRRLLGSVRGGAGAQFRASTGKWALTLGPVAEFALTPLNAHPTQGFFSQSHAYSFGIEASIEFGR